MEIVPCGTLTYQAASPYPEVRAARPDRRYAQAMLSNIGGSNSEMSAVALYFYDHLMTWELPEVAEAFHHISVVEMHHLEIFGTLARQLGTDPRLWCRERMGERYWSGGYLTYPRRLGPLLQTAIREENAAIRKYEEQARWIRDPNIRENLARILEDERLHLQVLATLSQTYLQKPPVP